MMLLLLVLLGLISHGSCQLRAGQKDPQRGTFLGHFDTLEHEVGGAVWALDEEWLRVEDFTYDGRGPDAFFWVGTEGEQPSPQGFLVPFPSNGSGSREMVLPAFHGSDVLFRLPDKLKVSDLRWISVWCRRFTVNFGSLLVPRNIELPMKRKISELSRLAHGVRSGNVTLLDAKTLYIPNLHYDGSAPDAFFWVGKGKPDRTGHKIPNEKQSTAVLGHYDGVDIELVLPDNLTLYDIDYLSIWCVMYRHNFGHVMIPQASELYLPPALGQTQVKAGSELPTIGSDKRNQYAIVDQVPNTESAVTEMATGSGATWATEAKTKTETRATETETEAYTEIDAMTEPEATTDAEAMIELETKATKTQTMPVTEVSFTESESKVTKTETETTKSESGRFSDDKTSENEVKMPKTTFRLPGNDDNKPSSDPNLSDTKMDSSTTFASNYSEVPPEDLRSLANSNLTVNEHIFKYDQDPEIHPVALNNLNHITEWLFHNDKDQYTSAVGNDDTVQHAIDTLKSPEEFDDHDLVKINIRKHFGAYFFAKPNGTTDNETNETSTSHKQGEVDGYEAQEVLEDLIHPYHQHPKDIHSVKAAIRNESDYSLDAHKDDNRTDKDDNSFKDKLNFNSSSDSVSVTGVIYNSLFAAIGDSILLWRI